MVVRTGREKTAVFRAGKQGDRLPEGSDPDGEQWGCLWIMVWVGGGKTGEGCLQTGPCLLLPAEQLSAPQLLKRNTAQCLCSHAPVWMAMSSGATKRKATPREAHAICSSRAFWASELSGRERHECPSQEGCSGLICDSCPWEQGWMASHRGHLRIAQVCDLGPPYLFLLCTSVPWLLHLLSSTK